MEKKNSLGKRVSNSYLSPEIQQENPYWDLVESKNRTTARISVRRFGGSLETGFSGEISF